MAARAICADHHERANGVACCLLHIAGGDFDAAPLRLGLNLLADGFFDSEPIAIERGDKLAVHRYRPAGLLPGSTARVLENVAALFLQRLEEILPLRIDRRGILLVTRLQVLEIGGISAIEE